MQTVQAVVFDMDGVLIDSEALWCQVREEFCRDHGMVWTMENQLSTMGCNTRMWSRIMVERLHLSETLGMDDHAVSKEIIDRLLCKFDNHLPRRDGAIEAVKRLATNYKVALATGSPMELATYVIQVTGLDKLFQAAICGDDVVNGKPAPDIYVKALKALGVAAHDAVGIEDSENGIRALHAAGMGIIAAPDDRFPVRSEVMGLANFKVRSMNEISIPLVEKVGSLQRLRAEVNTLPEASIPL